PRPSRCWPPVCQRTPVPFHPHSLQCFYDCSADPGHLHSFPTRRSSDLPYVGRRFRGRVVRTLLRGEPIFQQGEATTTPRGFTLRSEEHTSELQSRENLVCRLLLEKKKNPLALES